MCVDNRLVSPHAVRVVRDLLVVFALAVGKASVGTERALSTRRLTVSPASDIERIDGRIWGPDLFAWAYDSLVSSEGWRGQQDAAELEHDSDVISWRDAIRGCGGWVPAHVIESVEALMGSEPDLTLLRVVVAIDRAYVGIRCTRPMIDPANGALVALADEWELKGSLERSADGLVLRKGSQWRAGSSLAHYCEDLARISPRDVHRARIVPVVSPWSLGELAREQGSEVQLTVAFVPTLSELNDVRFLPVGDRRFAIELAMSKQMRLEAEALSLVESLEQAKVNVALLPETVAMAPFAAAIRQALVRNFENCAANNHLPALRLLIVGVAGDRANEAHVYGGAGEQLMIQAKTQRWMIERVQRERYGLEAEFGDVDRSEDIAEASEMTFLDSPGLGRIGVLICEDLARGDPSWLVGVPATPTVTLAPVFGRVP